MFRSMGRTKHKLDGHKDGVSCLALIKENLLISAGEYDKTLKVWDITTYQCIKSLQVEEPITTITILPDRNIAASSMSYIKILNIEDFHCIKIIKLEGYNCYSKLCALSNDKLAYFCCCDEGEFDEFQVWLLILGMNKDFDCIHKISEEDLIGENGFALLDDKFAYATNRPIKIRSVLNYEHFKTLEGHTEWVNVLLFVKKYNIILSGSRDTIRAWCTISYQCCRIINHPTGVKSLLLLPNGYFASGPFSDSVIEIWDISNYECINTIQRQSDRINSLIITEDKRIISASYYDDTILICDK
jgi:WD40 repeat protein